MEAQTPAEPNAAPASPEGSGADGKNADPSTHFVFKHRIFHINNCRFSLNGSDKLPCFYVPMGEQVAAIELKKLPNEFDIPKEDVALLKTVEKGLKYVKEIRPSDSIPREILDGSASWAVEDKHKDLARARLNQELIFWITGFRSDFPPLADMQREQRDQEGRMQIRDAHVKLTQLLGLKDPRVTAQRAEDIIRETPYLEALRERASKLDEISQKLVTFASSFKKEATFGAEVMRMQDLMRRATRIVGEMFSKADNALKEVPKALGDVKATIGVIREVRDDSNVELKKWNEHFEYWGEIKIDRSEQNEKYFRKFYQFLAENYMEQAAWGSPQGAGVKKK